MTSTSAQLAVPGQLAGALHERQAVLFAGAGLSQLAGAPSWSELLSGLVEVARSEQIDLGEEYDRASQLATDTVERRFALAGRLRERLTGGLYESFVREQLEGLEPTAAHLDLASVKWAGYVTTNFDTLIEDAHEEVHGIRPTVITWKNRAEIAQLDSFESWVFKLHGCRTQADSIVFDQSSLDDLLSDRAASRKLGSLLERLHTVFFGYGLGDPDVMMELRRLVEEFALHGRRHFAVLPNGTFSPIWKDHLSSRYSVHPLLYNPVDGNHELGVKSWSEALLRASTTESTKSSRAKILYCVKALRTDDRRAPTIFLLVTDDVRGWGIGSTDRQDGRLEKAFLLPSVDDVGQDPSLAAEEFASLAGIDKRCVHVIASSTFETTKDNPALDARSTDYAFRFAAVEIDETEKWFDSDEIVLGKRTYGWKTIDELLDHEPTRVLNQDVLEELTSIYGARLENMPFAMTPETLSRKDPYLERADCYSGLAWVQDDAVGQALFEHIEAAQPIGVLDLGCGPATAARHAAAAGLQYVGVDRSTPMIDEAIRTTAGLHGCELVNADFRQAPIGVFDGWAVLLKNVLHLIPNISDFLDNQLPKWGNCGVLAMGETVSPDPHSRYWVETLFDLLGANYKHHVFGRDDLRDLLAASGWSVEECWHEEQFIDVGSWLGSFNLMPEVYERAMSHIVDAPARVIESMQIQLEAQAVTMLRLQNLLIARRS